MPKFRKKPVIIEAWRWDETQATLGTLTANGLRHYHVKSDNNQGIAHSLYIKTLEGEMFAGDGDWIIKGVNGEFYPCKDDIFKKTYERVIEPR